MNCGDMGLTSTQKGTVTEHMVASLLMLASGGRLSPFMPMSDDHGIDLIVLDKITNISLAIQIKSAIANPNRSTVQFDVRKATHAAFANRYLLAVLFEPDKFAIAKFWLIPMADVPTIAIEQATKFALSPSTSPTSRDRYHSFRYDDPRALAEAIVRTTAGASTE